MSFARPRPLRRAPFLEDLHPPQGGRTAQVELIFFSRATSRRGHARATFYDKRGAIQRFLILNAPPFGLDAQLAPLFEGPGAQRRHYQVLQAALGSVRVL